ncbi:UvrD-helicase domain-containing protein [Streptomyces sp. NBC_01304]|uniref:UvrD-helicase domain-containing protein n=1 Tax=Streptomyces sp. NBC_01304 TaxID=2903818 RepID=UPI002E10E881|nr:UvrD-helicase domain-containing protein [Streptomyces sp. NBC_01304]WSJ90874.1 UvrD-helicase domain-containing protein [Streptomyces sp. NBC_01304]
MSFTPTEEQAAALKAFSDGDHLVIQAGAGTGKTSTLAFLAEQTGGRRGRYLAFNRAIAQDAATRFPASVQCKTAHSLAYGALGHRYRERLNSPRRPGWKVGQDLGLNTPARINGRDLLPATLSNTVLRTVARYCQSADTELAHHHVPQLRGLDTGEAHAELADLLLPYAAKAWDDLQNPQAGMVRFEHDHYLKMWALTDPALNTDYLLLDEAQDTNPVLEQIVLAQRERTQIVMVGDSAQAIYGWRGARDVMTGFQGHHLTLTRSFRFGPRLADEANRWLTLADAPIRLTASADIPTTIGPHTGRPDAVLCRTNIGAITEILTLLDANTPTALAGGGDALRALAQAARDLIQGRRTHHPELVLFTTWNELRDYAELDPAGADLQPFANLVDDHGPDAILNAVDRLVPETQAQVTVSTAHKAKGREWPHVRIAPDFTPPPDTDEVDSAGHPIPGPIDPDEARLAYVAVTRARHHLDLGGLSWIHQRPDGNPVYVADGRCAPHASTDHMASPQGPVAAAG